MRQSRILALSALLLLLCNCSGKDTSITPVPFTEVGLDGGFWQPRMQTELDVTVPFSVLHCAPAQERFRRCADYLAGKETPLPFPDRFISSDMYKVMEGVAYSLMLRPDPALEEFMDSTTALIAASQLDDGYLYITHTCHNSSPELMMGDRPYSHVVHSHELYNVGHLYEAAVAYYQATGKRALLDIAVKSAEHVNKVFFEGDPNYNDGKPVMQAPGHEEIELALCKMYRLTGRKLYLDMAKKFLDIRGVTFVPDGEGVYAPTYAQQHQPVKDQREAVGHCVRAMYLYTAMAQVDALTGRQDYTEALDAIWRNLVSSRIHITGGLGADRRIEGFGNPYSLPNKEAYDETCAGVGNVFFNQAMFLAEGDARYLDVAEISLFNNALSGISLSGDRFFYVNPLETDGNVGWRQEWFSCACCPPNISRLILQTPGYMYAHTRDALYVTLYAGNHASVKLGKCKVDLRQTTEYPNDGHVVLNVDPSRRSRFSVRLRIPTWCRTASFMPEDLYRFEDGSVDGFTVSVNGERVEPLMEKGFAVIDRVWQKGDVVELDLTMNGKYAKADERVKEDAGCHAFTRGPLVFCDETVDGVTKTIPYYTWCNTAPNPVMKVWLPEE